MKAKSETSYQRLYNGGIYTIINNNITELEITAIMI